MAETLPLTDWMDALQAGDEEAAAQIWRLYWPRVVALARTKIGDGSRRAMDEEDVAMNALESFLRGARQGQFPKLRDADELWSLLATITARKAINQRTHQTRLKRGGDRVRDQSALAAGDCSSAALTALATHAGDGPTPDLSAQVAEQLERYMEQLDDPTHRVIILWKLEGRTNTEMARCLDCSLSAIERKLRQIRQHLAAWAGDGTPG